MASWPVTTSQLSFFVNAPDGTNPIECFVTENGSHGIGDALAGSAGGKLARFEKQPKPSTHANMTTSASKEEPSVKTAD
jgi:hypothetical protein